LKRLDPTFADRLETAAKAKQALLEKARQKDPANDPEFTARQAARLAAARAREERETELRNAKQAERDRERAERERIKAEQEQAAADEAARRAEQAAIDAERAKVGKRPLSKPPLSPAEQKAARDARYAARKAAVARR
jgi:hypothetical protein